ncbi:hypothetical protein ACFPRL_18045 [Pseudoclavibacter helvolus]
MAKRTALGSWPDGVRSYAARVRCRRAPRPVLGPSPRVERSTLLSSPSSSLTKKLS